MSRAHIADDDIYDYFSSAEPGRQMERYSIELANEIAATLNGNVVMGRHWGNVTIRHQQAASALRDVWSHRARNDSGVALAPCDHESSGARRDEDLPLSGFLASSLSHD